MYAIVVIFFSFSLLWSIEVDIESLKIDIQKNTTNIPARMILARNYISNGNFDNADKLLSEVLKIDNNHRRAILFKKDIQRLKQISVLTQSKDLTKSSKITSYFTGLFNIGEYKSIIMMYEVMQRNNISFEQDAYTIVADSYMKLEKSNSALKILEDSSLPSENVYICKAKIEELKNNDKKAEFWYKKALVEKDRVDTATQLYDFYIKRQREDDAKYLIKKYQSLDPKSLISIELKKREQNVLISRSDKLEDDYRKSNLYSDFKKYYYEMEGLGYKKEAFSKLRSFVDDNPKDEKAVLFLAKQYYWKKQPKNSLKIMKTIIKDTNNRDILTLYSNILLEFGKKKQALIYLRKIVKLGGDTKKVKSTINKIKTNHKNHKQKQRINISVKEKAETLYFHKEYLKSLPYYIEYFKDNKSDSDARFHLADALEKLKLYPQSENQYRLVAKNKDKLFTLSLYRFARVLMAQKDEVKWDKAKIVLTSLLEILEAREPSVDRDNLLKYTIQDLEVITKPMPKPTKHKDIMLTESQKKILSEPTLSGTKIDMVDVSSVESMIGSKYSDSIPKKEKKLNTTLFGYIIDDDNIQNHEFGVRFDNVIQIDNTSIGFELKRSKFEEKSNQDKIKVDSIITYFDRDNLSFSMGLNNLENATNLMTNMKYHQTLFKHNLTYALDYQNGVFTNGIPCMAVNDIDTISLSLYDLILLRDLQHAEFSFSINRSTDSNININSSINYPIHKRVSGNFENIFALVGNYEYNTKEDTCYGFSEFFDGNYLQLKSKYRFLENNFIEGIGSLGYSINSSKLLYSYGVLLQIISNKSFDISIDCRHFQSGYNPDGANECYASITHVW